MEVGRPPRQRVQPNIHRLCAIMNKNPRQTGTRGPPWTAASAVAVAALEHIALKIKGLSPEALYNPKPLKP